MAPHCRVGLAVESLAIIALWSCSAECNSTWPAGTCLQLPLQHWMKPAHHQWLSRYVMKVLIFYMVYSSYDVEEA